MKTVEQETMAKQPNNHAGTPEQVIRSRKSFTGEALRKVLQPGKAA